MSYDARAGAIRLSQGQITRASTTSSRPALPTISRLRRAGPEVPEEIEQFREVPESAGRSRRSAATRTEGQRWDRLDFIRQTFLKTVIASGAGNAGPRSA